MSDTDTLQPIRKTRRQKVFAVLPTLLTLCNAACGFGAITIAAKIGPEHLGSGELITAAQLIFLAMVFDMLDGSAARLTNQTSDFGAQLDSLCDAISFGVAPAFILLQLIHPDHHQLEVRDPITGMVQAVTLPQSSELSVDDPPPADSVVEAAAPSVRNPFHFRSRLQGILPRIFWAIAVLFMVCAILRLARFNVETDEDDSHDYFSGLPSPAAAGVVASFPIGLRELNEQLPKAAEEYLLPVLAILLPVLTLAAAILMVSRIRYAHVFNQLIRGRRSRTQILQIVFAMVLVYVVRELALPVLFCSFAFASPIRALWQRYIRPQSAKVSVQPGSDAA